MKTNNIEVLKEELAKAGGLTIVIFSAPYCGQCRLTKNVIEKYLGKNPDINFFEFDLSQCIEECEKEFAIKSIPVTVFYENGIELCREIGVFPETALAETINNLQA